MSKSSVYKRWVYMKSRCDTDRKYILKGITVCDRWLCNFENFYADMGSPPKDHSLDRINGSKGYSPDNCRWATWEQQNRNLSNNTWINGELKGDIAQRVGVSRSTVQYRHKQGLPLDAAPITERTTCKKGHEWTVANTYWAEVKSKQGGTRTAKYCRACRAGHQADLRKRTKPI